MGIVSHVSDAAAAAGLPVRLAADDRALARGLFELHAEGVDEYSVAHLREPGLQLAWGNLLAVGFVAVYREGTPPRPVALWLTAAGERFVLARSRSR